MQHGLKGNVYIWFAYQSTNSFNDYLSSERRRKNWIKRFYFVTKRVFSKARNDDSIASESGRSNSDRNVLTVQLCTNTLSGPAAQDGKISRVGKKIFLIPIPINFVNLVYKIQYDDKNYSYVLLILNCVGRLIVFTRNWNTILRFSTNNRTIT